MELYAWQQKCLDKWKENGYRGTVNVVTGAGKTVLALEGARRLEEAHPGRLRVRIVTPTLSLARQWASAVRTYEKATPANGATPAGGASASTDNVATANGATPVSVASAPTVAMYHGERKDAHDGAYTIYVVNSARYALARHVLEDMAAGYHVLLIADECHHYAGAENRRIFDFLGKKGYADERYHCLGLSATPRFDEGGLFLEQALGREISRYRFQEAVREGIVTPFFIYQIGLSFLANELRTYDQLSNRMAVLYRDLTAQYPRLSELSGQEFYHFLNWVATREGEDSPAAVYVNLSYQRAAVSYMAAARSACVCELIRQLDQAARILVFCERIGQAEELQRLLRQEGIGRVGSYHSQMPDQLRKRSLQDFRDGEVRILISCKALDEGLDVPDATVGIVMSGSSMTRQRIQRIGRLLRLREGKSCACLYYLYVRESAEDGTFLLEYRHSRKACNLSYDMLENVFQFPAYEEKAAALYQEADERGAADPVLKELRRCLLLGLLRPDWMAGKEELERRLRAEQGRRERNYLYCMKRLAEVEVEAEAETARMEEINMDLRDKKIAVIGVGGVGGYLAGMLIQQFPHVTLVARGERGRVIRERGLTLHSEYKGEKRGRPEKVVSGVNLLGPQDYIFICVKNYSLEEVCRDLVDAVTDETVIIPVMNGVDAGDRVREYLRLTPQGAPSQPARQDRPSRLFPQGEPSQPTSQGAPSPSGRGATVVDSLIYTVSFARPDYSIQQQGQFTNLRIGIQDGDARQQRKVGEVSQILAMADIDHETAEDIRCEVWKKYILNCAYNVETAYFDETIGQLRTDPKKAALYEQLILEACDVARAEGIRIPEDHAATVIHKFYHDYGDDATSSLQRDIRVGRQSELETFSGYLVREARRLGVSIPISERMYEGLKEKVR